MKKDTPVQFQFRKNKNVAINVTAKLCGCFDCEPDLDYEPYAENEIKYMGIPTWFSSLFYEKKEHFM